MQIIERLKAFSNRIFQGLSWVGTAVLAGVLLGLLLYSAVILITNQLIGATLVVLVGAFVGFLSFLFALPLIPTVIERLSNKPNRNRAHDPKAPVSDFGFFTPIQDGQVKIIQRGDKFDSCVMAYDGHTFKGEIEESLSKHDRAYWEVVSVLDGPYKGRTELDAISPPEPIRGEDSNLLKVTKLLSTPIRYIWWMWKRWVYAITGYVFTGIYPFRTVKTYSMVRYKKVKNAEGHDDLVQVTDFSDHFRVADFEFPTKVPEADTQDKVPVSITIDGIARIFNPYDAAYGTDNWSSRSLTAIGDKVTHFTRPRPLEEVLSAKAAKPGEEEKESELRTAILNAGDRSKPDERVSVVPFGMEFRQILISDISPVEPRTDIQKQLAGLALARVNRAAQEEKAKGDAAQLQEQIRVVKDGGQVGLAVLASERDVRTATAAGPRAVIVLGGGGNTDPIQAAMLQSVNDLKPQST